MTTNAQPKVYRTKGYMGEVCEYINDERKCTGAGVLYDKQSTFIIYQSKVEWYSSSENPMMFKILKTDSTIKNIITYVLKDMEHTRYVLNVPTDDRKLLVLASNEATITFYLRD